MLVFLTESRKSLKFRKGGNAGTANSDLEQSLSSAARGYVFPAFSFLVVCWMATAVLKQEKKLNQVLGALL